MSPSEIKEIAVSETKSERIHVISKKHPEELVEFFSGIDEEHVLTRYFEDKKTKDWYAVIESTIQNLES